MILIFVSFLLLLSVVLNFLLADRNESLGKDLENARIDSHFESPNKPVENSNAVSISSYNKYCNARFGFCIDYPENILFPQGESDNGDGQTFKSSQADVELTVSKVYSNPEFDESLEQNYHTFSDNNSPNRTITYQKLYKTFYIVSGQNNGKIFYLKTILLNGEMFSAYIEYPESKKELYNPYCQVIYKTFK